MIQEPKDWYRTRVALTRHLKMQILQRAGSQPREIQYYQKKLNRQLKASWAPSSYAKLSQKIMQAEIVLGADFHSHQQSQRAHLRILRDLPESKPVILVLECFKASDQKFLDAYMKGQISEDHLLAKTRWNETWSFPWTNYKPLLDLAKARQIPVFGVNKIIAGGKAFQLKTRDEFAAQKIFSLKKAFPDSLLYVVYGEIHLADALLPRLLVKNSPALKNELVRIYQDYEELYFKFLKKGTEPVAEVFSSASNSFCILTSPPWLKWQSYLLHLERVSDPDGEEALLEISLDLISDLVRWMARDLKIKIEFDVGEMFTPEDSGFLKKLEHKLSQDDREMALFAIENDRSFFLPEQNWMYLSHFGANQAATLAGSYIHATLSARKKNLLKQPQFLLQAIWIEAVSFYLSLLINPKRKSEDLNHLLSTEKKSTEFPKHALAFAVRFRLFEHRRLKSEAAKAPRANLKKKGQYFVTARILGQMLGVDIFNAFRRGRLSREQILSAISMDLKNSKFEDQYFDFLKRLQNGGRQ